MRADLGTTEHWFYHLERSTLENALPPLLEKVLARDWRALIRCGDAAAMDVLDKYLWTYKPDSFLPHGPSHEPHAQAQPILLTQSAENENSAQIVILVHGADAIELDGVQRCITMFDGGSEQALAQARSRWKAVNAQGAKASYWRQDENGRWSQQG